MRKFLIGTIIYLLAGCPVTAGFLDRQRGGRDDVGAKVGVMILGPFAWPVLLLEIMGDVAGEAMETYQKKKLQKEKLTLLIDSWQRPHEGSVCALLLLLRK